MGTVSVAALTARAAAQLEGVGASPQAIGQTGIAGLSWPASQTLDPCDPNDVACLILRAVGSIAPPAGEGPDGGGGSGGGHAALDREWEVQAVFAVFGSFALDGGPMPAEAEARARLGLDAHEAYAPPGLEREDPVHIGTSGPPKLA